MRHLALALALISTAAFAQPDLIVQDLYTDSLCLGPNPYFSIHFTITNIGDENCEYFCYEKNGIEVCPDTTLFDMSLDPNESRYYYLGWLNYDGFGEPYTIEVVNAVGEVNTLNNAATMIVPDEHICEEMLSVDLAIDTVLYNTGCDEYGPYLAPSIHMTNLGTDDITELCIKFQVLGQTNDTVCFTGQSYLPLESGESAVQYWPRIYADGVLSLHLLDVNGPSPFSWLDFGIDEWTYNNTYVEVLPNISSSWCVSGCTDETACNYVIEAALEDGSCEYPELYYDCEGECEYDTDEDGICDQLEIPGCTDPLANNYNADATDDDGTCEYTVNLAREVYDIEDLNVYPNPFDDVIYVSNIPGSLCRVRDLNGKIVVERTMSAVISMNYLEGGMYLVDWIVEDQVILTKKIMKR